MNTRLVLLLPLFAVATHAQLTTDQRLADFRNLGDLYARRYAGIEWKKSALNVDVLNLKPWLDKVAAVKDDLDFYDLMVGYVSSLQDAHDQYLLPSDFEAHLGFTVDLYDGKILIDSIDQSALAATAYPFEPGDELVSVDGRSAADLVTLFSKYVSGGNPRTVQRLAAELITDRYQVEYPRAHEIGDSASVVINRRSGATESYNIPWQKVGTPLTTLGPSVGPNAKLRRKAVTSSGGRTPFYLQTLQQLRNFRLPGKINVVGFGELQPVFQWPTKFTQRMGTHSFDSIYSGTYVAADGTRIGFLRLSDFFTPYLPDIDKEIRYFQANTDVLVVDVMRNPGGDVCLGEEILSRLSPNAFQGMSAEIRVGWTDVITINEALADAQNNGADDDTVAQLVEYKSEFQDAFSNRQGRTKALPLCGGTTDRTATPNAYSKPVLLLADEMSASSADIFAAMVQDNHVAPVFGYRTMGAGGSPEEDFAGVYSEGDTTVTRSLAVRLQPVVTPDYPTTPYIENVGVRPDIVLDFMTADNLLNHGAAFVNAFTDAAMKLAKGTK